MTFIFSAEENVGIADNINNKTKIETIIFLMLIASLVLRIINSCYYRNQYFIYKGFALKEIFLHIVKYKNQET